MTNWKEASNDLKERMSLWTEPIAYRKFAKTGEMDGIENLTRWKQGAVFCQMPFLARVQELTVGITREDKLERPSENSSIPPDLPCWILQGVFSISSKRMTKSK